MHTLVFSQRFAAGDIDEIRIAELKMGVLSRSKLGTARCAVPVASLGGGRA
jgi:hypothetical protein